MSKKIISLLFFIPLLINAQVQLTKTTFDLGKISKLNEDVVDVYFQNTTEEKISLLRMELDEGMTYQQTSMLFPPGQPQIIRIKVNPNKLGSFEKKVKLHLSSNLEPITLTFSGKLKSKPTNKLTACPSFGSSQRTSTNGKTFSPPRQAFVEIHPREEVEAPVSEEVSNPEREAKVDSRPATARRPRTKKVKKTAEERRNSPSILTTLFGNQEEDLTTEEEDNSTTEEGSSQEDPISTNEIIVEEQELNPNSETIEKRSNSLSNEYKANNVVFLIDASTSMREEQRMDILKTAMIQLLEPLRPIDFISIVTYSGDAKVLLAPTSAVEKETIKQSIENIVADGSTQAVKGIKKAIQTGKSNFLDEGNNQIILATDGAFDIGERNESLRRKIEKTAKEGLSITVIGIKNDKWTNKSLKEIVELGEGNLIRLNNFRDADKVLEEVKRKSAR